jgi:polar amino acid transport system substrate-binding protein
VRLHTILLGFLFLSVTYSQSAYAAETYKIVVDDWIPYSYVVDGKQQGTDVDLLRAVGKKIGITFEFEFVPWLRALEMAKSGQVDGIISLYNLPERRKYLIYTTTPISSETIILISSAARKLKPIASLKDLAGLSIGVNPDTSYGEAFDRLTGYVKEQCMSTESLLAMLIGNRMDAAVINQVSYRARVKQDPTLADKIRIMPLIINKQDLYLAFSKKAHKNKKFPIEKISRSIAQLRKDGTLAKIQGVYLGTVK